MLGDYRGGKGEEGDKKAHENLLRKGGLTCAHCNLCAGVVLLYKTLKKIVYGFVIAIGRPLQWPRLAPRL